MAMEKKYLGGLVRSSRGFFEGEYMPWAFTGKGAMAVIGIAAGATLLSEGLKGHNVRKLGKVSYADGPARMTGSFTSGAIQGINRASGGNTAVRNEMFANIMKSGPASASVFRAIDDYGADAAFISGLYNMGV